VSTPLRERPDAPLGTLIFRAGLLPAETIESALEEGVKTGKRLGEILTERGLLKEVDLARLLAGQKGLDFVPVREHIVDPAAASLFTHDQARLFSALPYAFEEGVPVIAIPDPTDEVVLRNIREAIGREDVRFVVSTRGEIAEIVEDVYSKPLAVPDTAAAEPAPVPSAPAQEEPSFVQNPDPPAPPAVEAPPDPVLNGNGAAPAAAEPEAEQVMPAAASEPAPPPEVAVAASPEPSVAPRAVEEQVVPESPPAPEPESPVDAQAVSEPLVRAEPAPAEPEVAQIQPVPAPEPVAAPEPVSSPEPPSVPEPVHSSEPPTPAAPPPTPIPLPEPVAPPAPAPYPPAASAPTAPETPTSSAGVLHEVTIRLANGERVEAGTFQELAAAKECAKALIAQVAAAGQGEWPFVSGRFLKPETIVSVDIAEHPGSGPGAA
jgi:hypothetical protein